MATSVTYKQNDSFPAFEVQLTQSVEGGAATPINFPALTGTVFVKAVLIMKQGVTKRESTGTNLKLLKVSGDTGAGESGHLQYAWPTSKTAEPNLFEATGKWEVEIKVEYTGGKIESFPNEGSDEIVILPSL